MSEEPLNASCGNRGKVGVFYCCQAHLLRPLSPYLDCKTVGRVLSFDDGERQRILNDVTGGWTRNCSVGGIFLFLKS